MNDDNLVRLFLIIIFACVMPCGLYHRMRSKTDEKLDRWQEGALILFGLRLSAVPCFLGAVAWLVNPSVLAWSSVPIPFQLRLAGLVFVGLAGGLLVWTFHNLGKNLTDTVVTRMEHTLVTTGPYRWVRHPFYLAFAMGVLGGALATANWFLLLCGCIPLAFLVARTRIEEAKLIERFGDQYREYIETTGRFLPRIS